MPYQIMKTAYPVKFTRLDDGYMVYVPDMAAYTQGDSIAEAIEMARDVIGLMGIDMEDDKQPLPTPSDLKSIECSSNDFASMVDIDFLEYRRANDRRTVRRNVSLPSWLDMAAEKAGIHVSSVLQNALKKELHISE